LIAQNTRKETIAQGRLIMEVSNAITEPVTIIGPSPHLSFRAMVKLAPKAKKIKKGIRS